MPGLIDAVTRDALRAVLDASRQIPHNGRRDRVDGDVDARCTARCEPKSRTGWMASGDRRSPDGDIGCGSGT